VKTTDFLLAYFCPWSSTRGPLTAIPLCQAKDIDSSEYRHHIFGYDFPHEDERESPVEDFELGFCFRLFLSVQGFKKGHDW
jgi:hypothetical protein